MRGNTFDSCGIAVDVGTVEIVSVLAAREHTHVVCEVSIDEGVSVDLVLLLRGGGVCRVR